MYLLLLQIRNRMRKKVHIQLFTKFYKERRERIHLNGNSLIAI